VKNKLINNLTKWIESFGYKASTGTISSGDSFVNSKNYARFHIQKDTDVVDMESCAIAQVCSHSDVDFCFIKLISDYTDSEKSSAKQWEEATKDLTVKLTEVIINVCYQIIYLQH
jgi:nucleoside phosphorylase